MKQSGSWRQILMKHSSSFLEWLAETEYEYKSFDRIANHLSEFLISRIRTGSDALEFWNTIPNVRSACNAPDTYQLPWAAEAYAFVHLLMRYSRAWSVLKYLTTEASLPLGSQGVRVLDIGAGPAPVLYAIDDFYNALNIFAQESGIQELCIPLPELDCIENSQSMNIFMHHFSEHCGRRGPFGATIDDFRCLDFLSIRHSYFKHHRYKGDYNATTGEEEEFDDSYLTAMESNSIIRYRLIIFSNFFTLACSVRKYEQELRSLFDDLSPGSVVIISGATGKRYQEIYEQLTQLAHNARMKHDEWNSNSLGEQIDSRLIARMNQAQHTVSLHLENLAGNSPLPKSSEWPEYSDPKPSSKVRRNFALRVFRRGNWPSRPAQKTVNLE